MVSPPGSSFDRLFAHRRKRWAQALFRLYGWRRPLRRPIFVIGLNRSGTSFFTRLLACSRQIVNWSEANEMWDPAGYPWEEDRVRRPFWPLDPQGYTDGVLGDNGWAYLRSIPGMCAMYTASRRDGAAGGARFLNKSPMNVLRMPLLLELFPDACFISLVRDPRAVVRSWAEKIIPKLDAHPRSHAEFSNGGVATHVVIDGRRLSRLELLETMCDSYQYVVRCQAEHFRDLPDDQKFFTAYEAFVADIHGVLREIDEAFDLDPDLRDWDRIPANQESRNVKFADEFSTEELAVVETRCATAMRELGYG